MSVLVQVEKHILVFAALKQIFDFGIGFFKRRAQIFHLKVQLGHVLSYLCQERRYIWPFSTFMASGSKSFRMRKPSISNGAIPSDCCLMFNSSVARRSSSMKIIGEPGLPHL